MGDTAVFVPAGQASCQGAAALADTRGGTLDAGLTFHANLPNSMDLHHHLDHAFSAVTLTPDDEVPRASKPHTTFTPHQARPAAQYTTPIIYHARPSPSSATPRSSSALPAPTL